MGTPILNDFINTFEVKKKLPGLPTRANSFEQRQRYQVIIMATNISTSPVPKAAPSTPSPAPGTKTDILPISNSREGYIRKN